MDKDTLEWAAQWITDSLKGETNERVIQFANNMAMTLRAAAHPAAPPPKQARQLAEKAAEKIIEYVNREGGLGNLFGPRNDIAPIAAIILEAGVAAPEDRRVGRGESSEYTRGFKDGQQRAGVVFPPAPPAAQKHAFVPSATNAHWCEICDGLASGPMHQDVPASAAPQGDFRAAVDLLRATRQILAEYESDEALQIQARAIDRFLSPAAQQEGDSGELLPCLACAEGNHHRCIKNQIPEGLCGCWSGRGDH